MSRSKAKHNKMKCAPNISNKEARSKANRKLRRITRQYITIIEEFIPDVEDDNVYPQIRGYKHDNLPQLRDVSDPWAFPSDGLAIHSDIKGTKWERR